MEILINDRFRNRKINFFNKFSVHLKYDAIASSFAFQFYFDPNNIEHKELACLGHYHICKVTHNGETLITGNLISNTFNSSKVKQLVSLGGYSLTGVLEDVEIAPQKITPNEAIVSPYQFDLLSLRQIATQLLKPFGLEIVVDPIVAARMDEVFEESNARPSQNIKTVLSDLCLQKNIVLSHTETGKLFFTQASPSAQPITLLTTDLPVTGMSLSFNGQGMHSHIRVIAQANLDDENSSENEVRNPYVINTVYRPKVVIQNSRSTTQDTFLAAKNILAQELKNVKLTVNLDRWDFKDKIVRPGQTISVINPEVYCYEKTDWMIEDVALNAEADKFTSTLTCVPPEAYNGVYPPKYKWAGINLH